MESNKTEAELLDNKAEAGLRSKGYAPSHPHPIYNHFSFFLQIMLSKIAPFCKLNDVLEGRIAQLVERLSYTQVVIGSSPVAPILLSGSSSIG